WPKPLGGSEAFDRYLAPVFESSEGLLRASATAQAEHGLSTGVLMVFSLAAAGLGILVAWQFYLKSTEWPDRLAERFGGLYRVLVNEYYVDLFYDSLVVRPVRAGLEALLWYVLAVGMVCGSVVD